MPRIADAFLECSLYFYPSAREAAGGENVGGSGLMVAIQSKVFDDRWYANAVTNGHVIREGESLFIRVNTKDGKSQIVATRPEQWHHHPAGDDIAVCPIRLPLDTFKYRFVSRADFLTQGEERRQKYRAWR